MSLGWTVEVDEFVGTTPIGDVTFRNIMGHVNPDSPRRLVIGISLTQPFTFVET